MNHLITATNAYNVTRTFYHVENGLYLMVTTGAMHNTEKWLNEEQYRRLSFQAQKTSTHCEYRRG